MGGGGGVENFVDIFGGHHKIGLYLVVISMHCMVFLKVKVQNQGYNFWGCQNFKYNFGVLEIPHIFFFFFFFFFFLGGGEGVNG